MQFIVITQEMMHISTIVVSRSTCTGAQVLQDCLTFAFSITRHAPATILILAGTYFQNNYSHILFYVNEYSFNCLAELTSNWLSIQDGLVWPYQGRWDYVIYYSEDVSQVVNRVSRCPDFWSLWNIFDYLSNLNYTGLLPKTGLIYKVTFGMIVDIRS